MSLTIFYHIIQIVLQICSLDQSLVTLAFLWEKLSQPQVYKDLTRKTTFCEGWSLFKINNVGLTLGINFRFYISVEKRLKLKVRKLWGLIPTFAEVTGEKLVERAFLHLPLPPHPDQPYRILMICGSGFIYILRIHIKQIINC